MHYDLTIRQMADLIFIRQCAGMNKMKMFFLCLFLFYSLTLFATEENKITLFAAASLTNALTEVALAYEKSHPISIQKSFASSATLAKQIEKGAPADIFMAADTKWMQYLEEKNLIQVKSKQNLLGNQLVVIAPSGKIFKVDMEAKFNFSAAFSGKLCTGETESVPAGIYAKEALQHLNWWDAIKPRIVGAQDVRAALVFVERGECDAGIVYATDAKISKKVALVATFPETSHAPIVYPLALVKGANAQAADFYQYLNSDRAKKIFTKYGFKTF